MNTSNRVHRRIGLRDSVTFSCPFCSCGTVTGGTDEDDISVVLHTEPKCEKYLAHDEEGMSEFLKDCKTVMQSKDRKLS